MPRLVPRLLGLLSAAVLLGAVPPATAAPVKFTAPEYVMGSPQAKVTVTEYASLSCPHCARFDINVFPAFKRKYVDTGRVRYVFREFLTPPAEVAAAGFLLARCAGQDRYFGVVDALFHRQEEMFRTGQVFQTMLEVAHANGLSNDEFRACIGDQKDFDLIQKRTDQAVQIDKVESTPSFLINGKRVPEMPKHEMDLAQLDHALQPWLKPQPARAHHTRRAAHAH